MKKRERNNKKTKFIPDCLIHFEVIFSNNLWHHMTTCLSRKQQRSWGRREDGRAWILKFVKKEPPLLNVRTKYLLCRPGPCSSELRNSYLTALARLDISTYSCWLKSGYTHLSQKRAHIASLTANEGDVTSKPFVLLNQIQVISYIRL